MKKAFYLSFFLLFGLSSGAQDLREMRLVGDAHKSESEIVSRRDNNGNLTAAIMVISDMDGFSYDAYNGVVGNVDSRPGMDIVYLQTTERVLEIYKTGYRPLKIILADEGIRLKPQEVWQISIAGDELLSTLPVIIRYTPDDARLLIDGELFEKAPTYNLSLGQHSIKIEKTGYLSLERSITINEQNIFFEYTLELEPDAGIEIETIPAGAIVYLDGVRLGETPLSEWYKPGVYPIRIVKDGYVTIENQTLEVKLPQITKSYKLKENFEMVFVKGGTFTMGCTEEQGSDCWKNEKPKHQVTLRDFYIGKFEVTQKQWREIMGNNPSKFSGCDDCPIENVSWNDVQTFIKILNQKTGKNYRLPTEAEWEYAARGGQLSKGYKYSGGNNINELAWYEKNSGGKTNSVGKKKANELGIYDLSCNVWEWCEDDWHNDYKGAPKNGRAWINRPRGNRRIIRGGSWADGSKFSRVSIRGWCGPGFAYSDTGFRLAHDF